MTKPAAFSPETLLPTLSLPATTTGYCVALSGGADSVALLVAMAELRPRLGGKQVRAIHVHHGLQAAADDWSAHCRALCRRFDIPLQVVEITVSRRRRESLEMAARRCRYRVLGDRLGADEALLMAHHLDDQAETLLLHLFRGAGVEGLSAMPAMRPFSRGMLLRPLLAWRREALTAFLRQRGIPWVEDPSNRDTVFDRNYIRHVVLPAVEARWPAAVATIGRAVRLQAEQRALSEEMIEEDFLHCYRFETGALDIRRLMALEPARRRRVLRRWLRTGRPRARWSHARIDGVLAMVENGEKGGFRVGDIIIRPYRGGLYKHCWCHGVAVRERPWPLDRNLHIAGRGVYLESSQLMRVLPGLSPSTVVEVRERWGSCPIRVADHVHRPLKKLLQEWGVPPWEREGVLTILHAGTVVVVLGRWVMPNGASCEPVPR